MWITGDELVVVDGQPVTAEQLAEARQEIAHNGTGVPLWHELTDDERQQSRVAAAGWVLALGAILNRR
jgi:UDP-N-acetyl-D-mannosaminuronic acid transferase (WecB/TagA/CpsF family)